MSRMVSFIILILCIVGIGGVFVAVMAQFLLPMFLAAILVVLFRPMHEWLVRRLRGRTRLAAGLTTMIIVLIVLAPLLLILSRATTEAIALASGFRQEDAVRIEHRTEELVDDLRVRLDKLGVKIPAEQVKPREMVRQGVAQLQSLIAPVALRTTQFLGNFLLGLFIMLISLYFFLADGPAMIKAAMQLSPLDDRYEEQLLDQFVVVSRAVVMATLLSALAQGLLAGVGYAVAGLQSVFLLTALTMFLALVPFVGATGIWAPCSLYLYFFEGRVWAAVLLALWGLCVVSVVDNFIKPWVLHGQSNLHPLLALLSVLGGITTLGPIGILVGPMVVAFLQALLNILRAELETMETKPPEKPTVTPF